MLVQDLVKINLVKEGYLPNYPYHLLSTEEMCLGFYTYFNDTYPEPASDTLKGYWTTLYSSIIYHAQKMVYDGSYTLPDWVYSYMLGAVIGPKSDALDIHDLIAPLYADNLDDIFGEAQEMACYTISRQWTERTKLQEVRTLSDDEIAAYHLSDPSIFGAGGKMVFSSQTEIPMRPPTIFGEPHVVKSLRLGELSLV